MSDRPSINVDWHIVGVSDPDPAASALLELRTHEIMRVTAFRADGSLEYDIWDEAKQCHVPADMTVIAEETGVDDNGVPYTVQKVALRPNVE